MRKAIILVLLTIILMQSTKCDVVTDHKLLQFGSNLQFFNKTGAGLTPQQMSSFIAIANYASSVYHDDIEKNMKYIKLRMDALYGKTNFNFFVFIQTQQDIMSWRIFVVYDCIFAAVQGINKYYPKWSYFFTRNLGSNIIYEYAYFHTGIGKGLSQQRRKTIKQITLLYQQEDSCTCSNTTLQKIGDSLYNETSQAWSIICDNLGTTYSLLMSYSDEWITLKPKNCYYTIYT